MAMATIAGRQPGAKEELTMGRLFGVEGNAVTDLIQL
jgi:hypothetical protein